MKRKTNLFYTSGPDSKFLTFSNYAESLTGNFISTDHKLFPSRFLCMNLEGLNEQSKSDFIKLLAAYYENKMAVLRDDKISKDENIENSCLPLAYLVECLMHIKPIYEEQSNECVGYEWDNNTTESLIDSHKNMFNYIGDISEEDYDGTYSDIICFINLDTFNCPVITKSENVVGQSETNITSIELDSNVLYGWNVSKTISKKEKEVDDEGNEIENTHTQVQYGDIIDVYDNQILTNSETKDKFVVENTNVKPIFDNFSDTSSDRKFYSYNTCLNSLNVEKSNQNSLIFNIIIPLYDLVNINHKTNSSNIDNSITNISLVVSNNNIPYTTNVPLGIWISLDPVEIKIDQDTLMSPTWSLLISTQFKALPYYSKNVFSDGISNSKILETSNSKIYNTFASVIVRQNQLIDNFVKIQNSITKLNERITLLQNQINVIGTNSNIDSLYVSQVNFESDMQNKFNSFKNEVMEYFKNLTWKATI